MDVRRISAFLLVLSCTVISCQEDEYNITEDCRKRINDIVALCGKEDIELIKDVSIGSREKQYKCKGFTGFFVVENGADFYLPNYKVVPDVLDTIFDVQKYSDYQSVDVKTVLQYSRSVVDLFCKLDVVSIIGNAERAGVVILRINSNCSDLLYIYDSKKINANLREKLRSAMMIAPNWFWVTDLQSEK